VVAAVAEEEGVAEEWVAEGEGEPVVAAAALQVALGQELLVEPALPAACLRLVAWRRSRGHLNPTLRAVLHVHPEMLLDLSWPSLPESPRSPLPAAGLLVQLGLGLGLGLE
jgi:hypothetical protein